MGPVNWIAVILAANLAVALAVVWYGPLFGDGAHLLEPRHQRGPRDWGLAIAGMLLSATMIGHNFARVLYFMMSGGLALAFVGPAIYLGLARYGVSRADRLRDCGYWIVAYLAMGSVFWALG